MRIKETPSREEVAEVLGAQASHIRECGLGGGETVKVDIVFEGASGRPVEISYPDEEIGRSVRVCIESNLVHAVVHPFTRETFKVSYPFKLREDKGRSPGFGASESDED